MIKKKLFSLICFIQIFTNYARSEDKLKVVVTALFYTDAKGRILLVTGPLPRDSDETIQTDLQGRLKDEVSIHVVPIFEQLENIPFLDDVLNLIKKAYSAIYIANIPKEKSGLIVEDMRRFLSARRSNFTDLINQLLDNNNTYNVSYNVTPGPVFLHGKFTKQSTTKKTTRTKHKKKIFTSPEDFIPNDIYYGIEKTCVNWNQNCRSRSPLLYRILSNIMRKSSLGDTPALNWFP